MSTDRNLRLAVACAFADAIDHRAYETALELLAENCVYRHLERRIRGPVDIIRSYQQADELSSQVDRAELASAVDREGDAARITFVDRHARGERNRTHRCYERLEFNEEGYIVNIVHEELGVELQPRSTSKPSASQ